MKPCPICRNREANKKNVHLIPWFLIKKCITERGSGERDMELSFSIDPTSFTKMYTGRGILPENIEEFGELHDFQKEKENPYSRDNIICAVCEDNLSRLEAIFASQFADKKLKSAFHSKLEYLNGHSVYIDSKYNSLLYHLLIQSIFYRCSIGRFNGFSLNQDTEKKIEENLRIAFLIQDFRKLKATDNIDFPNSFPVLTCSFYIPVGEDPTKNFIVVNKSRFPYFIMAGKWMFQLFEAEKHLKSSVEWLYGLNNKFKATEANMIIKDKAHVLLLDADSSKSISDNLIHFFTEKRIEGLRKNIRDLHVHIFKHKPDEFIGQYIFKQYFFHLNLGKTEFKSMVHAFYDLKKLT
jgi:hypothetical protein